MIFAVLLESHVLSNYPPLGEKINNSKKMSAFKILIYDQYFIANLIISYLSLLKLPRIQSHVRVKNIVLHQALM